MTTTDSDRKSSSCKQIRRQFTSDSNDLYLWIYEKLHQLFVHGDCPFYLLYPFQFAFDIDMLEGEIY